MNLLRIQRLELECVQACGKAIVAIGANCIQAAPANSYNVADIFVKLEILARAVDSFGFKDVADGFRQTIARPSPISETALPGYVEAIQIRKRQLDRALKERGRDFPWPDDPRSLLRSILSERHQGAAGQ